MISDLFTKTSAEFSPCERYRYSLTRRWDNRLPGVCFVMLNPSTATAEKDDPTIRRCVGFAKHWGYGGVAIVNLFALRSTDPAQLYVADDPIGPKNDEAILEWTGCRDVVCAWGAHGAHLGRGAAVLSLIHRHTAGTVMCLGVTQDGQPKHPLYIAKSQERITYPRPDVRQMEKRMPTKG